MQSYIPRETHPTYLYSDGELYIQTEPNLPANRQGAQFAGVQFAGATLFPSPLICLSTCRSTTAFRFKVSNQSGDGKDDCAAEDDLGCHHAYQHFLQFLGGLKIMSRMTSTYVKLRDIFSGEK